MVERPADVLPMDRTKPSSLSMFGRVDMALRKMPGLGIFIVIALAEGLWERGDVVPLAILAFMTAATLLKEFLPPVIAPTGSLPK